MPIREFTQQISVIQRALSSLENIDKLFREIPEEQDAEMFVDKYTDEQLAERFKEFQELRFKDVYFRYTDSSPWVLQGVSFKVKKGNRVAIIGATGSGKSTIVRVLNRIYTSYEGSITINGVELREIPRRCLQKMIALMQQESYSVSYTHLTLPTTPYV